MVKEVKDIRITDPYVRRRVEAARRRAGESTSTKTAARLILERLAQVEMVEGDAVGGVQAAAADGAGETTSTVR
jgi:hypothetical protein